MNGGTVAEVALLLGAKEDGAKLALGQIRVRRLLGGKVS